MYSIVLCRLSNSIISEIVDKDFKNGITHVNDQDVRGVFVSILHDTDLDIREKKSAIIDFVSAGIETVS